MLGAYLSAVQELGDVLQPTTIDNLPDLWPKTENYGKGPLSSTRVHKHRFVFDENGQTGTAYVQFKNLRQKKNGEIYEKVGNARTGSGVVYAYYNMPYADYVSFTNDSSKGHVIRQWTEKGVPYENLGKNDTIFTAVSPARFDVRKERYKPNAAFTPYEITED